MSEDLGFPVRSVQELSDPDAHVRKLREVLAVGLGSLIDSYGIDWWEFANPYRAPVLDQILQASQLATQVPQNAEVSATRPHLMVRILSDMLAGVIATFLPARQGIIHSLGHYAQMSRTLSPSAVVQIAFDKWDADYSIRRRLSRRPVPSSVGGVLLPSAYRNVTRTQMAYARMLPQQQFLSVVTRRDGRIADALPNMQVRSLAAYVPREPLVATERENARLRQAWSKFNALSDDPALQIARRLGTFKDFPKFIATGLRVRDAWDAVLRAEKVSSVLSADENNPFTRLPVWLAHRQGIPTVYAEHGALNFNLGLRVPCSDRYLARDEMMKDYWQRYCHMPGDKIELGAPADALPARDPGRNKRDYIVFFSSDYELSGGRAVDFYREVLPPLCVMAKKNDRSVILKLHPFESLPERRRCVNALLTQEQRACLELRSGPLDSTLLDRIWIALTVESSAAVECALAGIPTFLCSWFDPSWWEYGKQFVRFSVAQALESPEQIADLPKRMSKIARPQMRTLATTPITRARLESILGLRGERLTPIASQNLVSPDSR
jgi:hypothetical protein